MLRAAASTCTSLEPVEPVPGFPSTEHITAHHSTTELAKLPCMAPSDQPLASGCFVELIVSNVIFDD